MNLDIQFTFNALLAGFYIFSYILMNYTAFLISAFYKKKFNHSLMNTGFLASIVFCTIATPTLFFNSSQFFNRIRLLLLISGVILSSWNAIVLYLTMRKVRK